jgi:pimeloyl-ACP methyl ester carboxylesterase
MTPRDHDSSGLAWREAGVGPAVLFLHGLGGTRTAWEPQLEALSDRFRCIAWDMPGYGESAPLDSLDFASIASAIVSLLNLLDLERAHVVGLSFGGQQAMHLALTAPDRIGRLVLADTSAQFGVDGTDPIEWKRDRLGPLDGGATPADIAPRVITAIAAPGFAGRELDRTLAAFARIPTAGLRAAVECLPTHDVSDRLPEIASPTLVIVGELDEETPVGYAEQIASAIPGARLAIIPGVGHLSPAEAPEQFNALVAEFLSDGDRG